MEKHGIIERIDVTEEMLERQKQKIKQAKIIIQQRKKEESSFLYRIKKFFELIPNRFADEPPKTVPYNDEWYSYMIDKMIYLFPVEYEEECLKSLELGIKPRKGFILHRVYFK